MTINFDLSAWLIGFLLLAVLLLFLRRRDRSLSYLFFFSLFWVYLLLVAQGAVFPIYIDPAWANGMRGHFMDNVNLKPFYFGPFTPLSHALPGLVLNTLLTMPAGFGISFITRFRPANLPWLVAVFGFGIEGMQLLISLILGYPYRTIDINDVIFNSLGVLLGYGVFKVFAWLYAGLTRRWSRRLPGILSYIHDIAAGYPKEMIE